VSAVSIRAYDELVGANCEMEDVMNSRVGLAFLIGFGVGAATALLLAPQSGEETREWISDRARESLDQTSRVVEDAFTKSADAIERGKDRASQAAKKVYTRASAALG
jgi:gas vesicle protein